jgi:hypothetical protein
MTIRSRPVRVLTLVLVLSIALATLAAAVSAQGVATLRTPGPDAAETAAPGQDLDEQEAVLAFAGCMRDNGIDFPDPQFGVGGAFSRDGLGSIDFLSRDFLDAMEACEAFLSALQPELDPQQQAEQVEQQVAFAQCMRSRGVDFPDPDPARGFTFSSLRGDDGGLAFDPFSDEFLSASSRCIEAGGALVPNPEG